MQIRVVFFSLMMCVVGNSFSPAQAEQPKDTMKDSYSMGVFPFLPSARLEGIFAPIAAELSGNLGKRVDYKSASSFEKFMKKLSMGDFDVALVQPFDYVKIAVPAGYQPVVARNGKLGAVFVVLQDSPLQSLQDLKQKTIAMAPEVAALSYLAKSALVEAGLDLTKDVTIKYQDGHHSCLQQVATAKAAACATGEPALRIFEKKMMMQLKILARTPTIPDILFVVHPNVSARDKDIISKTLLNTSLPGVPDDLKLIFGANKESPFIPATDQDYDVIYTYWQRLNTQ